MGYYKGRGKSFVFDYSTAASWVAHSGDWGITWKHNLTVVETIMDVSLMIFCIKHQTSFDEFYAYSHSIKICRIFVWIRFV